MRKLLIIALSVLIFKANAEANLWVGVALPEFKLADQSGNIKSNSDFMGHWMVLYFYPKDRTPGCTVEAQNFSDDYKQYQMLDTNIVGVSYDDVASHQDFAQTYAMQFTLLADVEHDLSKALKVDRIFPWPHASRQTFVVNPAGFIVKHYEDVTPETHSQTLLQDLKKLQQTDSKK